LFDKYITKVNIPYNLLSNVWNGVLDNNLSEIVTNMNKNYTDKLKFIEFVEQEIKNGSIVRGNFWEYRINYIKAIQQFTKKFLHGEEWEKMHEVDKIHTRSLCLLYGGHGQWSNQGHNITWMGSRLVVQAYKDGDNKEKVIGLMNEFSNPETYMRRQIAKAKEQFGATDPISASMAWETKDDMDMCCVDEYNNICFYGRKSVGNMRLRFDMNANSSCATDTPVENIGIKGPGVYKFYANLYNRVTKNREIPFTYTISINGKDTVYNNVWDYDKLGYNSVNCIYKMIEICTVEITKEMFEESKQSIVLSDKQANRLSHLMPKFKEHFGTFTTRLATVEDLQNSVELIRKNTNTNTNTNVDTIDYLTDLVSKKRNQVETNSIESIIKNNNNVTMTISGRSFNPTVATVHSCKNNLNVDVCLSTYYRNGHAPMQPDSDKKTDQCRFDEEWTNDDLMEMSISHITPLTHPNGNYDGYFLSIENMHLPDRNGTWTIAGGMYVRDLKNEYHEFREIWDTHHVSVRPIEEKDNIGIGIFVHKGDSFITKVNGVEKEIDV
jgi:hypothetical protein